ncbi:LLM class F420-dependent oxidoreductase [Frankia sp. AgB1.9]|uniref:LLM class F420-dependent oxidoreductase n=1 Tax=unclassified Frankia TaxID=2632575 RepID=UPI001931AA53|nr:MULTISPECIES: LLM class F420-dependent oxidoreductase [unclassified Frankia]MBL7489537.1 LLM class F420-dependent oxidoreductase [Frankia sp. AgW1.1]MBL7547884.1 LLM class F420-dependent oxidoreductase [Frankia sp. AgB1.9]MBL7621392.1 LLM class F420-dependent oxidoreductase [Frankia sp. AgB1.8]
MTADLKLGLNLGYWPASPPPGQLELVTAADDCGYASLWTAEAWGSDAVSPLAWYGAHTNRIKLATGLIQLSARTPACTAMTVATLDHLSGGRVILGLGVSGPQVVEGWYGVPFPKPLARTREYVDIVRKALAREEPVTGDGPHYPLPYPGGTGLGKPLKMILHPLRPQVPIYLGAEGPRNVALAAEIADGWVPIFYHAERGPKAYADALAGARPGFEIACPVTVSITDDVAAGLRLVKWTVAFYIGGMGARTVNFHYDLMGRLGYADEAAEVQRLFLAGDRAAAAAAVPDDLADGIALVGPLARIRERLGLWRDSPVTTLLVGGVRDPAQLRALADLF